MQHCFAAVTEARSFDRHALERATNLVDNKCCERFALNIFGDDHELLTTLHHFFENRYQVAYCSDLATDEQNICIVDYGFHAVCVGNEIWRDVALVETHSLDEIHLHAKCLALFNSDDTVFANFVDGFRNHLADFFVSSRD